MLDPELVIEADPDMEADAVMEAESVADANTDEMEEMRPSELD
jgi:hypothetical protein